MPPSDPSNFDGCTSIHGGIYATAGRAFVRVEFVRPARSLGEAHYVEEIAGECELAELLELIK